MFNYSFSRRPAVAEVPSSENPPLPNETAVDIGSSFGNVDIVGHKLSFINVKEELDQPTDGTQGPIEEEGEEGEDDDDKQPALNDDSLGLSPKSETDELSIQMEDLSGSIFENLPSSDDNSVEPDVRDNLTAPSPPTFVFHPIGNLLEQDVESDEEDVLLSPSLRPMAPAEETLVTFPLHLSSDVSNAAAAMVVTLATKPPTEIVPSLCVSAPKERVSRNLRWCFYLVVAMTFVMWWSTKLFVHKDHIENPMALFWKRFISSPIVEINASSSDMDLTPTSQHPLASPTVSPTAVVIQNTHPISSADGEPLMNAVDSASVFNILRPSFSIINNSKMGLFLNMTYWTPSSFWLIEWIQNLVATVRFIYATVRFIASAIYTLTILLPGLVCFGMLLKFIHFVSPTTTIGAKKQIPIKTERARDTFTATDMLISVHSLCRFLRLCQGELSRCGRRSRVAPPSNACYPWYAYDKSAYEGLSTEDLKLIGDFLGITGLNALSKHKINLIGAIIVQYESILRKLTISEQKQVLEVLNLDPPYDSRNGNLLKIIVEAGF